MIVLSCKTSRLQDMVAVYRDLAARCPYPLHLGLTEAGMGSKGIVSTTAALGILLQDGIGDTIRASLTPEPGGDRTIEVRVCREILQSLGLRAFRPEVDGLPGLRAHDQHGLPGAGRRRSRATSSAAWPSGARSAPGSRS